MHLIGASAGDARLAIVRCHAEAGDQAAALHGAVNAATADGHLLTGHLADEVDARDVFERPAAWLDCVDAAVHLASGFQWAGTVVTTLAERRAMSAVNVATAATSLNAVLPHLADGSAIVLIGANAAQPADRVRPLRRRQDGRPAADRDPHHRAASPRQTRPEPAADAIAFLASRDAGAVTGTLVPVAYAA